MNKLQKLIDEAEARKKSHNREYVAAIRNSRVESYFNGREDECDFFIFKLTLLLNAEAETNGEKDCKNDGNAV